MVSMTTASRAQMAVHVAAETSILAAYMNEELYEGAKLALAQRNAGEKPIHREELVLK